MMVLVTGATGFVGSQLISDLLQAGYRVRAMKQQNSIIPSTLTPLSDKIEWVEGNILELESLEKAMSGITQVYHCAAIISFKPEDVKKMYRVNIEGTANVVNTALHTGIKKLVHVSSIASLGGGKAGEPVCEEDYWDNFREKSAYSISKHEGEREVWRGMEEGLDAVIVNPSIIIGPGEFRRGSGRLFQLVAKELKFYTGGVNGMVDVRDVSKCMIALMESPISKQRFIISSENISFKHFFSLAARAMQKKAPSYKAGSILIQLAWGFLKFKSFMKGKQSSVSKESLKMASKKHYYSNEKIKKAIGFSFMPVNRSIEDSCIAFLNLKKTSNNY